MRFDGGINFYSYAQNSPTNFIDPFGLAQCIYSISDHMLVCRPNDVGGLPPIVGEYGPEDVRVGPSDVFSGLEDNKKNIHCKNNPKCEWTRNEGPIPPGLYKMNYYTEKANEGHDRFRLEPWPNGLSDRIRRDWQHWRFHGLGAQLHRGHYSMGCINAVQDDPGTMHQYDLLMQLLMSENGKNFLTVIE